MLYSGKDIQEEWVGWVVHLVGRVQFYCMLHSVLSKSVMAGVIPGQKNEDSAREHICVTL